MLSRQVLRSSVGGSVLSYTLRRGQLGMLAICVPAGQCRHESYTANIHGSPAHRGELDNDDKKPNQGQGKGDDVKPFEEPPKTKNFMVISNTAKALYFHRTNEIASWQWFITDFTYYWLIILFIFVGAPLIYRFRMAQKATAEQARLGETLLDQRTRDLLSDIEQLRKKDPLRLESEANTYHDNFWRRRAKAVSVKQETKRTVELTRGMMQGEARGTDMTEWLGAKEKDESEREVARRTHDYIQGFHQHLKSKRLI